MAVLFYVNFYLQTYKTRLPYDSLVIYITLEIKTMAVLSDPAPALLEPRSVPVLSAPPLELL